MQNYERKGTLSRLLCFLIIAGLSFIVKTADAQSDRKKITWDLDHDTILSVIPFDEYLRLSIESSSTIPFDTDTRLTVFDLKKVPKVQRKLRGARPDGLVRWEDVLAHKSLKKYSSAVVKVDDTTLASNIPVLLKPEHDYLFRIGEPPKKLTDSEVQIFLADYGDEIFKSTITPFVLEFAQASSISIGEVTKDFNDFINNKLVEDIENLLQRENPRYKLQEPNLAEFKDRATIIFDFANNTKKLVEASNESTFDASFVLNALEEDNDLAAYKTDLRLEWMKSLQDSLVRIEELRKGLEQVEIVLEDANEEYNSRYPELRALQIAKEMGNASAEDLEQIKRLDEVVLELALVITNNEKAIDSLSNEVKSLEQYIQTEEDSFDKSLDDDIEPKISAVVDSYKALKRLSYTINKVIVSSAIVDEVFGATYSGSVTERAKSRITAMISMGYVPGDFNTLTTAVGINWHLRPRNPNKPIGASRSRNVADWMYQRTSLFAAITFLDLTGNLFEDETKEGIINNQSLVIGGAFTIMDGVFINIGSLLYNSVHPNDVVTKKELRASWYIGLSINRDLGLANKNNFNKPQ